MCVCVCVCVCVGIDSVDLTVKEKGLAYIRKGFKCVFAYERI